MSACERTRETSDRRAELGEAAAALLGGEVRGRKLWALDLDALTVSVRDARRDQHDDVATPAGRAVTR